MRSASAKARPISEELHVASQQPLHSRSSRRVRDRRKFATHEHDNNARSDDDAQRPHDEPPKSDVPRGLGVGALHIFASDDDAATEIFIGNLIRPTDVLKVNDAAQFGAILRNSSDARPAFSQIEKIQEDLSNLLAACGEVIETTVSTKGHAFVKFKEGAAAERALALHGRDAAYKSTLHGRELVVQAKGKSELHELRKVIGSEAKLPAVERSKSGRNATWTLPDGGGLVAVPSGATLKETKERLARATREYLDSSHAARRLEREVSEALSEGEVATDLPEDQAAVEAMVKEELEVVKKEAAAEAEAVKEPAVEEPAVDDDDDASAEALGGGGEAVRNVCIIAHVDHGKTTLSDALLAAAGQLSTRRAGTACALDKGLEAERGITIYSSAVSLSYGASAAAGPDGLRLNLVDCPGHAEFNSEVTAALRLSDAAVLVVDAADGCAPQTETVLRQALADGVRPVLVLNKLDKLLPDRLDAGGEGGGGRRSLGDGVAEAIYEKMCATIDAVNALVDEHNGATNDSVPPLSLEAGTVAFGSAKQGWFATLETFVDILAAKATAAGGDDADARARAAKLLCGSASAKHVVKMVVAPIAELHGLAAEGAAAECDERLRKVGGEALALPKELRNLADGKALRRAVLSRLLPAAPALLALIRKRTPAPADAQRARVPRLFSSTKEADDDAAARSRAAVAAAEATGPLLLYVSKMVPLPGSKAHAAVARVLSGSVRAGQEVYVLPEAGAKGPTKPVKARSRVCFASRRAAARAGGGAGGGGAGVRDVGLGQPRARGHRLRRRDARRAASNDVWCERGRAADGARAGGRSGS